MSKLNNEALLVQLTVRQATMRKRDKKATQDIAISNNAEVSSGNYNKALLPMAESLSNIHKMTTQIRQMYYDNTLPWGIEGTMILPSKNYLSFMEMYRKAKSQWLVLVDKFINDYPRLIRNAEISLGSLYNASDYPDIDDLQSRFDMNITVMPVPADDFRVSIPDNELAQVRADVTTQVESATTKAMHEAWQRLYDRVKHISDKLHDPKSIFRDTLIDNTRDICDVLKRLNINDDDNLEQLRAEVEQSFTKLHPESLRNDPHLRTRKSNEASDIMKRMGAYMGEM